MIDARIKKAEFSVPRSHDILCMGLLIETEPNLTTCVRAATGEIVPCVAAKVLWLQGMPRRRERSGVVRSRLKRLLGIISKSYPTAGPRDGSAQEPYELERIRIQSLLFGDKKEERSLKSVVKWLASSLSLPVLRHALPTADRSFTPSSNGAGCTVAHPNSHRPLRRRSSSLTPLGEPAPIPLPEPQVFPCCILLYHLHSCFKILEICCTSVRIRKNAIPDTVLSKDFWATKSNRESVLHLSLVAVGSADYVVEPGTSVKFPKELQVPGCSSSLVLLGTGDLLLNYLSLV